MRSTRDLTTAPSALLGQERIALRDWFEEQKRAGTLRTSLDGRWLWDQTSACLDWHAAKGTRYKRWDLVVRNWIRKSKEWRRVDEKPQERGPRAPGPTLKRRGLWEQGKPRWTP